MYVLLPTCRTFLSMAGVDVAQLGPKDIQHAQQAALDLDIYSIADKNKLFRRASRRAQQADTWGTPTPPAPRVAQGGGSAKPPPVPKRADPPRAVGGSPLTGPRPAGGPPPLPGSGLRPAVQQPRTIGPPPTPRVPPPDIGQRKPALDTKPGPTPRPVPSPVPSRAGTGRPTAPAVSASGPPPPPPPPPDTAPPAIFTASGTASPVPTRPGLTSGGASVDKGDLLNDIRLVDLCRYALFFFFFCIVYRSKVWSG